MKISVAILILPETSASVVYSLFDVLSSVGNVWSSLTGEEEISEGFEVSLIAGVKGLTECSGRVPISPHGDIYSKADFDIVIVPDLMVSNQFVPPEEWDDITTWLLKIINEGAIICSVCTGAFVLANAGILSNKVATSHWSIAKALNELFPKVTWKTEETLLFADNTERIITSGGAATWAELTLYLTKRFFGHTEATRVAKTFLLGDRSDGQLPFAAMEKPKQHEDQIIHLCQEWIADNYAKPNPVARIVSLSKLQERTLNRRFKQATGYSPVEYIQKMRIEEAKQILETTQMNVDEIALQVGYEDVSFFRKLFVRNVGITPSKYRQRFQKILNF